MQDIKVAPYIWEIAALRIHINGKALLFRTISIEQTETHSQFHRAGDDLTLAQAAKMLSRLQALAQDQHAK